MEGSMNYYIATKDPRLSHMLSKHFPFLIDLLYDGPALIRGNLNARPF
jgi:hypothetical protein